MKPNATIREVARQAGVSVGTVSRVLHGAENISLENLSRVRDAMARLEYRAPESSRMVPSRRGGRTKRTGNIGIHFARMGSAWADHPLLAAYASGVAEACAEQGYHSLLEFADEADLDRLPRFLSEQKVDGILVKGSTPIPSWLAGVAARLPVVGMAMHEPGLSIPQVMPDNRGAGFQLAEYLWARGHRRIAFVCIQSRHRMFLHRMQGVQEFLRIQGSYDPQLIIADSVDGDSGSLRPEASLPDLSSQLDRLWSLPVARRPTAIIASNDWAAAGLHLALDRRGLVVPRDVSLAGFDNVVTVCCSLRAPLTSYQVPLHQTGYVAAKTLLRKLAAPEDFVSAGIQLISGRLVERESVASIDLGAADSVVCHA